MTLGPPILAAQDQALVEHPHDVVAFNLPDQVLLFQGCLETSACDPAFDDPHEIPDRASGAVLDRVLGDASRCHTKSSASRRPFALRGKDHYPNNVAKWPVHVNVAAFAVLIAVAVAST